MGIRETLGIGDQSLTDFLSLSDTPTLRNKYYSTLEGGLEDASSGVQLDQKNLAWQGIIPALATALLTKGKSLAFSGAPLMNVLGSEQKRAEDQQKLSIEAKLKGAGILGDELGKRETLAATAITKQEDQEQRERDSIRDSEDKRFSTQLMAETSRSNAAMVAAAAAGRNADRDSKQAFSESNTVVDDYEREAKPFREGAKQLSQMITLAQTAQENPENAKAALGMLAGLSIQISQGGGRVSDKDIALVGGNSADATLNKWQNWIDGGARGTMPEMTPQAIMIASRAMGKALAGSYLETEKKYRKRTEMVSDEGNRKKVNEYLDLGNPFKSASVSDDTKLKGPNGKVATLGELKSLPGWNDDMLNNFQKVE